MSIDAGVGILLGTALGTFIEGRAYQERANGENRSSTEGFILAGRMITVFSLAAFPAAAKALLGTITKTHIAGFVVLAIVNAFFSGNYFWDRDDEDAEKSDPIAKGIATFTKMINVSIGLHLLASASSTAAVPTIALCVGPVALAALVITIAGVSQQLNPSYVINSSAR